MPATEIEAYGDDTRLHFDGESDFPRFLDSVLQRTDQISQTKVACSGSEMVVESRSVKRNAKNARGLERDRAAEPVRIFLTACSGISAPDIPSDWSIVTVNIIT